MIKSLIVTATILAAAVDVASAQCQSCACAAEPAFLLLSGSTAGAAPVRFTRPRSRSAGTGNKHAQWDSGYYNSWEETGVNNSNQKDLTFAILNDPGKNNIEHIALFSAGYQDKEQGASNIITGQQSNWRDNINVAFGSNNWNDYAYPLDRRSAVWNGLYGNSQPWSYGQDMRLLGSDTASKTLVVAVFDAAYANPNFTNGLIKSMSQEQLNSVHDGWVNFFRKKTKFGQLKSIFLMGMSRGGCFVMNLARRLMQIPEFSHPDNDVKLILETMDPVCDDSEIKNFDANVPQSSANNPFSPDWMAQETILGNTFTFMESFKCLKFPFKSLFSWYDSSSPKWNNLRWKNSVSGASVTVASLSTRGNCDADSPSVNTILAKSVNGTLSYHPTNVGYLKNAWLVQSWAALGHCQVGRYHNQLNPVGNNPWALTGESACGENGNPTCQPNTVNYDYVYHHLKHAQDAMKEFALHPSVCTGWSAWSTCTPNTAAGVTCGGIQTRSCISGPASAAPAKTQTQSCDLPLTTTNLNKLCFATDWGAAYADGLTAAQAANYVCQYHQAAPNALKQSRVSNRAHTMRTSGTYSVMNNGIWIQAPTAGTLSSFVAVILGTTKVLKGTNTLFSTQVKVGQWIASGTQVIGSVVSITDDTTLVINTPFTALPASAAGLPFKTLDPAVDATTENAKFLPYCTWRTTAPFSDSGCQECVVCDQAPSIAIAPKTLSDDSSASDAAGQPELQYYSPEYIAPPDPSTSGKAPIYNPNCYYGANYVMGQGVVTTVPTDATVRGGPNEKLYRCSSISRSSFDTTCFSGKFSTVLYP